MTVARFRPAAAAVAVALAAFSCALNAADVPSNLGYGLKDLVENNIALRTPQPNRQLFDGYISEAAAAYAGEAISEADTGRVLVDITLSGRVPLDAVRKMAEARVPSLTIKAVDNEYRGTGILEGYVAIDDAPQLAQIKGVRAVFLALKPDVNAAPSTSSKGPLPDIASGDTLYKLGTAFDQGVIQHRVDRINQFYNHTAPVNYDGANISVGLMSDSYDTRTAAPHAATGVTNFDLPGAPGNPVNTQPVVVLHEEPAVGTDEGRAMVEIVYKMAPKARLAFATGAVGEVEFGNDIRALAALPGFEYAPGVQQGFKADVIADDISYGGEPFYGESIIGNAIDDVTAAGVSYFSSAGNNIGINAYESALRIVPNGTGLTAAAGNVALAGTNIDLTNVPTGLYAGGFHNFNPGAGQLDVAQLVNMPTAGQSSEMQWDDPYDQHDLVLNNPPVFSSGGNSTAGSTVTFDQNSVPPLPVLTQGTPYVIQETATSGNFDGIVNIFDSNNNLIVSQDTGTDEIVTFFPPATDQYHIVIAPFSTTAGNFTLVINTAVGSAGVTTDLNLLVFRADTGAYLASRSLVSNNLANNRPVELGTISSPSGQTQIQFVIARANNPSAAQLPTRVRWSVRGNGAGNIGPAEYFTYNAVTTKGHATAKGCNGTAAYSVFRPSLAESFTSPGPATILFDKDANRLAVPDIREVPRVAAADAANTSFFSSDSTGDLDANPNFSGTSAAAPHAAAIAALVLQSRGGSGSVSPANMRNILQTNVFPHDLDPSSSSGTALTSDGGGVVLTIDSDNDTNAATGQNDPLSFKLSYVGPGSLESITFNPLGTPGGAGHVTAGNNGYSDDVGSNPATLTYFENSYPGLIFLPTSKAFTLGTLTGLTPGDITAPLNSAPFTGFSNLAPAPANGTTMFWTMTVGFPTQQFTDGKVMRFTVGRGAAHSASLSGTVPGTGPTGGTVTLNPNADLFGGGVSLPSGTVIGDGMRFTGTTTGGGTFSGVVRNAIGYGYSPIDGYGFIDAAAATLAATTSLVATGTATPSATTIGGSSLLTVSVTPGAAPASTGLFVTANLSSIGGGGAQQLYDDGTHGDAVAGDKVYSYSASVGLATSAGDKSFPVVVFDAQGRNGKTVIGLHVAQSTPPTGVGSATPNSVAVTDTTLLTVAVTPGAGPASTGITVTANLTSIGGGAAQAFHDDGVNGDVSAGDGTFSFSAVVPFATAPGVKNLPVTISDAQARNGTASIGLTVQTPGDLTASGSATPAAVLAGSMSHLVVVVTPGTTPASSGITVSVDLSSIGGSASQAFADQGDGVTFAYDATVDANTAPGVKLLAATVSDTQGRSANATIGLNVPAPGSPYAIGIAASVLPGNAVTLQAAVVPGSAPVSTGITATVDLSAVGGNASQAMYDDGTHGDAAAGDGVYSVDVTVDAGTAVLSTFNLPVTVTDAELRSGNGSIALHTLGDRVFGDGFEGP